MAVICISCGREFDSTLFDLDRWVLCDCGTPVSRNLPRKASVSEDLGRERMRQLARLADRVCLHILDRNYPDVDIAVERSQLRDQALEWFPDCEELFEMVYEARFRRLWEQLREAI